MKNLKRNGLALAVLMACIGTGCKDKNDDVALPNINGYASSDAVASANLVAYWPLDGTSTDTKRNLAATGSAGVTYTPAGVKGQSAQFANGYIYSASAIPGLATNTAWSVSTWIQVANNGLAGGSPPANNHPYQYFQATVPGSIWGNINLLVEAGQYSTASDTLFLKSLYRDPTGGLQDAVLCCGTAGVDYKVVKKGGTGQWIHIVNTYNPAGGNGSESVFRIYADSVQVNNTLYENRGANKFTYVPGDVIIGGWYNNVPGKVINTDTWTTGFTGKIDEVRVYNKLLTRDEITALYKLGLAGR